MTKEERKREQELGLAGMVGLDVIGASGGLDVMNVNPLERLNESGFYSNPNAKSLKDIGIAAKDTAIKALQAAGLNTGSTGSYSNRGMADPFPETAIPETVITQPALINPDGGVDPNTDQVVSRLGMNDVNTSTRTPLKNLPPYDKYNSFGVTRPMDMKPMPEGYKNNAMISTIDNQANSQQGMQFNNKIDQDNYNKFGLREMMRNETPNMQKSLMADEDGSRMVRETMNGGAAGPALRSTKPSFLASPEQQKINLEAANSYNNSILEGNITRNNNWREGEQSKDIAESQRLLKLYGGKNTTEKKNSSKWKMIQTGDAAMGNLQDMLFNDDGRSIPLNDPPTKGQAVTGAVYKSKAGPMQYKGLDENGEPIYIPFEVQ